MDFGTKGQHMNQANNNVLLYLYLDSFKSKTGEYNIPKKFCKAIAGDDILNWYYGFFCPKGFGDCDFDCLLPANWDNDRNCWICEKDTVCYFTGYFDKNGVPIFERDLLRRLKGLDENVTIEVDKETIDSMIKINPNWIENAIIVGNVFGGRVETKCFDF